MFRFLLGILILVAISPLISRALAAMGAGVMTTPIRGRARWGARAAFLALCMSGAMTVAASLALAAPVLIGQTTIVPVVPVVPIDLADLIPIPKLIKWKVFPVLVRRDNTVTVSWEVANVASCTVTGSNGDGWTGLSGVQISSPIRGQTIYALHCPPLNGSPAPAIDRSMRVNIVPVFEEQ